MIHISAHGHTQCAAGQLVKGGWAELVFSPGDYDSEAKWFEWKDGKWVGHALRAIIHGHTCEVRDVDNDGNAANGDVMTNDDMNATILAMNMNR